MVREPVAGAMVVVTGHTPAGGVIPPLITEVKSRGLGSSQVAEEAWPKHRETGE